MSICAPPAPLFARLRRDDLQAVTDVTGAGGVGGNSALREAVVLAVEVHRASLRIAAHHDAFATVVIDYRISRSVATSLMTLS